MVPRKPEVVFHLAAQTDVRVSVADPVLDADINILGSLRALEGARGSQAPARWCSRRAAGRSTGTPSSYRSRSPRPRSRFRPTGLPKRRSGTTCSLYRELHGLEYTALALANVYGPRQDAHGEAGVVAIFAGRLLGGEPCMIFGDGKQTRDFVFVDDVVDAFSRAGDRGSGLLCNMGTGIETSVNDLYAAMARNAGVKPPAIYMPARSGRAATELPRPEQGGYAPGLEALDDHRQGHGSRP